MEEIAVRSSRDGEVLVVAMDRPRRANSLNEATFVGLSTFLGQGAIDGSVRGVVLCSEGPHFCAGADLDAPVFHEDDDEARRARALGAYAVIAELLDYPKPVVCAVQGQALGAALSLVLACDIRIGAVSSTISIPFVRFGLIPDMGLSWLLPTMIGAGRALDLALADEPLSADEARSWGLLTEVVPDGAERTRAIERARSLGALPHEGIREARRLMRGSFAVGRDETIAQELDSITRFVGTPEARQCRVEFLEQFRGARRTDAAR
jgi:2-(1,2-epoxy-1,2-dihydrophenyl)acetyl-CoA isomerase